MSKQSCASRVLAQRIRGGDWNKSAVFRRRLRTVLLCRERSHNLGERCCCCCSRCCCFLQCRLQMSHILCQGGGLSPFSLSLFPLSILYLLPPAVNQLTAAVITKYWRFNPWPHCVQRINNKRSINILFKTTKHEKILKFTHKL